MYFGNWIHFVEFLVKPACLYAVEEGTSPSDTKVVTTTGSYRGMAKTVPAARGMV